jgi:hypothetical protein
MEPAQRRGRLAVDLILLAGLGLLLSVLGPYRTDEVPTGLRTAYWLLATLGAGLIGIGIDLTLGQRAPAFWLRVIAVSLAMTVPVTLFVYVLNAWMLHLPTGGWVFPELAWQVLAVSFLIMTLRAFVWRRVVETRTVVAPPLPEADRVFRLRLSAKRRSARLIAVEAEDHYVRVHTDAGSELLAMRFAEAVEELGQAYGFHIHRSWWVAGDAIESVRWNRGVGEARLAHGIVAPVSRRCAPALKEAGWR